MTTIGSLFAGIGGLEEGLVWGIGATTRVLWQVEIDPFCRAVLAKHFPHADRSVVDVRHASAENLAPVDVLCGGFPCQGISLAGKGKGLADERSGLWTEMARLVRALRPRVVVVENVPALLKRGLSRVLGDLATCGYDAEWDVLPAGAVGAPHLRERLFIVAYPQRDPLRFEPERDQREGRGVREAVGRHSLSLHDGEAWAAPSRFSVRAHPWGNAPPGVRHVDDGVRSGMDEPRLKALGNAVVPAVAMVVGRRVREILHGG